MSPRVKRKYGDRPDWRRVTERAYAQAFINSGGFTGHVALLAMKRVSSPLYVVMGEQRLCVADQGYSWLQFFPSDGHYVITAMFDATGEVVQWYIDLCLRVGVDGRGVPYFDDLFLDVVVLPSGELFVLDEDELIEAHQWGAVTGEDCDLARREAARLVGQIERGELTMLQQSSRYRAMLLDRLP